ncbi:hypothetical protein LCGC14_0817640 [marine sediment metagenome]|uniref:Primase C-terminal 1 domain-containing protein n=1 Tax=marine sediment metagenome TaxID=412755 RepID=A0A0F9SS98_9ZZZZ
MNATEFLETIFSDAINDTNKLSIFNLPSRASRRFVSIPEGVIYIKAQPDTENVYFGLSLVKGNPSGRGKLEDTSAIGCLWADIDIANSEHKKGNLPPDIETARKLLSKIPLKPSIIASTGGGLHPYWVFKEPWIFETSADRIAAATLSRRLAGTLRNIAAEYGYDLDNVGALTQILRPPGTLNIKYSPPIEVMIIESNGLRYVPDDFEDILLDDKLCQVSQAVEVGDIVLRAGAEPPGLKLHALLENDKKFAESWNRKRKDLIDQTASTYCLSIATIAATTGWADQEIANLIIAWRELHNDNPTKALRWDWIRRTICKARTGPPVQDMEKLFSVIEELEDNPNNREFILKQLSKRLGITVTRFVQHGTENGEFSIELIDKKGHSNVVRLGTIADVWRGATFAQRIAEITHYVIDPEIKPKEWVKIKGCLFRIVDGIENPEVTSVSRANRWIESYLQDHPCWQGDWHEGAYHDEPFNKDGKLWFNWEKLWEDMQIKGNKRTSDAELCECLRLAGFTKTEKSQVWFEGQNHSRRRYWLGSSPVKGNKKEKKVFTQLHAEPD